MAPCVDSFRTSSNLSCICCEGFSETFCFSSSCCRLFSLWFSLKFFTAVNVSCPVILSLSPAGSLFFYGPWRPSANPLPARCLLAPVQIQLFFFIECYYIHLHLLLHTLSYLQFHTFTLLTPKYYIYTLIYIYLH